jgi:6-phosphogluconolactonase
MMDARRFFYAGTIVTAIALIATTSLPARAAQYLLYAGTYTSGGSKGIYAFRFNSDTGALSPIGLVAETKQPAHIWITPNGKYLYAVNWEKQGGVSAFRIDPKTAQLTFLNRVSSEGALPNQVMVDPRGRIAVTVNYGTGTLATYKILPDGSLSAAFYVDHHAGTPLSALQHGPKAHGVQFSGDSRFMYVAELGLDRVYSYKVDPEKFSITPAEPAFINTHAGAGPRRLQLSPDGRFLYINHETDSEVSVFPVQGTNLREIQTISTLQPGVTVKNKTAEIVIDSAGRHLYVSNRGDDSIAIFTIDADSGRLTLKADMPAGGRMPRNLRLDPTGRYLLSANQDAGNITVLKVDPASGALTATGNSAAIDAPAGLFFEPIAQAKTAR